MRVRIAPFRNLERDTKRQVRTNSGQSQTDQTRSQDAGTAGRLIASVPEVRSSCCRSYLGRKLLQQNGFEAPRGAT